MVFSLIKSTSNGRKNYTRADVEFYTLYKPFLLKKVFKYSKFQNIPSASSNSIRAFRSALLHAVFTIAPPPECFLLSKYSSKSSVGRSGGRFPTTMVTLGSSSVNDRTKGLSFCTLRYCAWREKYNLYED